MLALNEGSRILGLTTEDILGVMAEKGSLALKAGVRILGMKPETVLGLLIAASVYWSHGKTVTVTSGIEGSHSRGSKHYAGMAFDLRTSHLLTSEREAIEKDLKASLGADFDVVFEGNHFHIEYDPKEPYK